MNKVSVLVTATIIGSTSIAYAEVPEIIKKLGWEEFYENGGPIPETGGGDIPEVLQAIIWDLPANIDWDNDDPIYNLRLCRAEPPRMDDTEFESNRHMGDFNVTACGIGIPGGCETVLFTYPGSLNYPDLVKPDDPSPPWGGGEAIGTGWKLIQWGKQTWDLPWTIHLDSDVILDSIEIDLLSKKGPIKAGFDILLRPNDKPPYQTYTFTDLDTGITYLNHPHPSPGSGAGWAVGSPPIVAESLGINYTATFYNPIVLPGYTLLDPHDLYGKVVIEFPEGLTSGNNLDIPDLGMEFWQDTDCLPDGNVTVTDTDEVNGSATVKVIAGIEMNLYVQRVGETIEDVAGPFEISSKEQEPIIGTITGLQKGTLYQIVDRNADTGLERIMFGPERF